MRAGNMRIRYRRGLTLPEDAVFVARPSKWGNPFKIGEPWVPGDPVESQHPATREEVIEAYGDYLAGLHTTKGPSEREIIAELRGKTLACWCPLDKACHADVLLEIANACLTKQPGG